MKSNVDKLNQATFYNLLWERSRCENVKKKNCHQVDKNTILQNIKTMVTKKHEILFQRGAEINQEQKIISIRSPQEGAMCNRPFFLNLDLFSFARIPSVFTLYDGF